jgi:hypothetical protein
MDILVIFSSNYNATFFRRTFKDHLLSFDCHSNAEVYYFNTFLKESSYLKRQSFDLIIYHYSFMALKWSCNGALLKYDWLKSIKGRRVAIAQDEYINSIEVNQFLKSHDVKVLFSCCDRLQDIEIIYPKHLNNLEKVISVLPGYIETKNLKPLKELKKHDNRKLDIFYRARNNSMALGKFSLRKSRIAKEFLSLELPHLSTDISLDPKDTILGKQWFLALENSRVALGVEAGASVFDPEGSIRSKVEEYMKNNPEASYSELNENVLKKNEGLLEYKSISPRHFESIMFKTCQVLYEGSYSNILIPNKHYIELKKDFSNINEVLSLIEDHNYCQKIANNAYEDIVVKEHFTYKNFINKVMLNSKCSTKPTNHNKIKLYLKFISKLHLFYIPNFLKLLLKFRA